MKTMRLYEQADQGKEGFIYSWILDAPFRLKKSLDWRWKWTPGPQGGSFVTTVEEVARSMAANWLLTIGTNGTHQSIGAPFKLATT